MAGRGLSFKLPPSGLVQIQPVTAGVAKPNAARASPFQQTACIPFSVTPPPLTSGVPPAARAAHRPTFAFAASATIPFDAANKITLHLPATPLRQPINLAFHPTPQTSLVLRRAATTNVKDDARYVPLLEGHDQGVKGSAPEHNQWDVPSQPNANLIDRFYDLLTYVMCRGCCVPGIGKHPKSVLGDWGHIERLPTWTHFIAMVLFFGYSISCSVRFDLNNPTGASAVSAAWLTTAAFLTSAVYHAVSPDLAASAWLRQLDFLALYSSIASSALADLAAVTNGFLNVPTAAILDVPLAATALGCFFTWKRSWMELEDTTVEEYEGYSVRTGLYRRWHSDGEHSPLRQAGSLCIGICYFTTTPAVVTNLGINNAAVVLTLQVSAFVLVLCGMVLDNIIGFPDAWLNRGYTIPCVEFPFLGCVVSHHSIWHFCSIGSAILIIIAREFAISVL